jgi:hypothetical protein
MTVTGYEPMISQASKTYGVPENLIKAVIQQESGFHPNARSGAGAMGMMQLMPGTARSLGVTNPYDAAQNIMGGTKYLSQQLKTFNGSVPLALAAYNAGPGNVKKAGNAVPNIPETQNYVKSIMANYQGGNVDISMIPGMENTIPGLTDTGFSIMNPSSWLQPVFDFFKQVEINTTKGLIYLVLFLIFAFFAFQALNSIPAVNTATGTVKKAGKKVVKAVI